jgi:hypothetical protein
LKLSLRLPPHVDPDVVMPALERTLTHDAPYGAQVTFESEGGAWGWAAPPTAPWLDDALQAASDRFFGAPGAAVRPRAAPSRSWRCSGNAFPGRSSW